ncbi:MAG: acyltransferase [Flavobacterium sp.]|jgi:maltose O-acetyltransferase|nr:acyltransferase [Flavobacterium sp.]
MSLKNKILNFLFIKLRIWKYQLLSNASTIGTPVLYHPVLLNGEGKILFGTNCKFGYKDSPYFYSHYTYIEARGKKSKIKFGSNTFFNNNCSVEALESIEFGEDVLVGVNCKFLDNDGHDLNPLERNNNNPKSAPIYIGNNVFIGDNVTVLKGVTIGENSVIGNGSLVTKSFPSNVVIAGNPAVVINSISYES